jgi:hypothetical protein
VTRASPAKFSFNAGEISALFEGRIDYAKYGVSMRELRHFITTPQGPILRTGGTTLQTTACYEDKHSALVPYVFADGQALTLEFANLRLRFHSELGLQVYPPDAVTSVFKVNPFTIISPQLTARGAVLGNQIVLSGFPDARLVNGATATITAVNAGDQFKLDIDYHGGSNGPIEGAKAHLVYHVDMPYTETDVRSIVGLQDVDVVYLFCPGFQPRKLSRFGEFDWRLTKINYIDGPFMPIDDECPLLTPDSAGIATAKHTTAVSATGTASGTTSGTNAPWHAFDYDRDTYWEGTGQRNDTLTYTFAVPTIIEGYTIHLARNVADAIQGLVSKDFAPATWVFEGFDGAAWITLDAKSDFELYTGYRTPYIKFRNKVAFSAYRLKVTEIQGRGQTGVNLFPCVGELVMRKRGDVFINFTAASVDAINRGQGFKNGDVGRLIRVRCEDNFWRSLVITTVTDTTHITAKLQGEPLLSTQPIREWRMGYFSDTTGWPTAATWIFDRLAVGGITEFPTLFALSEPGDGFYDIFSPTDGAGTVNDDNAIAGLLKTRDARIIRWLAADNNALLIGTSGNEWAVVPNTDAQPFSARNIRAKSSTRRGSAAVQPVETDRQFLFVDMLKRTLYEHAYEYQSDGYESTSLSILASHIGVDSFEQLVYAQTPHSLAWVRLLSDEIAALTYNRKESVVGWHHHSWAGGKVESIAVLPSLVDKQDTLWMVVRRKVNGQTRRFIERSTRFWDFGMVLNTDATFVACSLRATFEHATDKLYVPHLIGEPVQGLADGHPFGVDEEIIVDNDGIVMLPQEGNEIVIGLATESQAEISRIEAGAADGSAQGKYKRIDTLVLLLWESAGGEIGMYDEDHDRVEWQPIEYPESGVDNPQTTLFTGMVGPFTPPQITGKRGTIFIRQRSPLPLNVIAMYPRLETQDGG